MTDGGRKTADGKVFVLGHPSFVIGEPMRNSGRIKAVRRLLTDSRGFSMSELVVVVSIVGLAIGLVGSSMFQVLGLQRFWRDDVIATKDLRHAGSWFSGDALNAQTTDLVDGAAPVSATTFTWEDQDGVAHTVTYSVASGVLIRNNNGNQNELAQRVTSAEFSRSGNLVSFILTVMGAQGATETMTFQSYLRQLS